jgi:hypothetical protein
MKADVNDLWNERARTTYSTICISSYLKLQPFLILEIFDVIKFEVRLDIQIMLCYYSAHYHAHPIRRLFTECPLYK